ncbi:hypothetical protein [Clostridium scatologenes]|uniref:Uncharacterized protein n=1 Tax=Clostridium scatologenes TaxID=1548 RepID=A0A0E3JS24_CLOSL|nr:hypothetical protein [Clostridium scatologenes]AKA72048.1 hypothetical protein CSCA_4923 [Clostridium scatologenes]
MKYGVDYIDGVEVPQLIVTDDFTIQGQHEGTVHVESGILTIQGQLDGTLDVQKGVKVFIIGKQNGTVSIESGAEVTVYGELNGTTTIDYGSAVIVEKGGKLAGNLNNNGQLIIRGVFGGAQSGNGKFIIEEGGQIKRPVIKNGISYYQW